MVRRDFLRGLLATGAAVGVTACGGGSGSSTGGTGTLGLPPTVSPVPSPAPAPTPEPTPTQVPTLRGVTIDRAEAEIAAPLVSATAYFDRVRASTTDIRVDNADEFQVAVARCFDALASNHRILCAWNGSSTRSTGVSDLVTIGEKFLTTGHFDVGGSLVVAAAPGFAPDFANTVMVYARGIKFEGIGFTRKVMAGENINAVAAVVLGRTQTFPITSYAGFENCTFGSRNLSPQTAAARWASGIVTDAHLADQLVVRNCRFLGQQFAIRAVAKGVRVDGCDFQCNLRTSIALYGHTFESGYYSHAWISQSTFRNTCDDWDARSNHTDAIQTGTEADRHLGYRVLVTDVVSHLGWKYSGAPGMGGGTQGFYNDDHLTADNQFVVRRSIFLVSSPAGFVYYSPKASRPSFVDKSTFTRSGHVPSAFAPDANNEDYPVGIAGSIPAGGPWLLVTDTIAKYMMDSGQIEVTSIDPRFADVIPASERPEAIFAGRDFGRGTGVVNGIANKWGYRLPNEAGSQARFVADVWANFRPKAEFAGKGAPDPTQIAWKS